MDVGSIVMAVLLSVAAYFVGWRAGISLSVKKIATAMAICGVIDFNVEGRSITFRDGTTHQERR